MKLLTYVITAAAAAASQCSSTFAFISPATSSTAVHTARTFVATMGKSSNHHVPAGRELCMSFNPSSSSSSKQRMEEDSNKEVFHGSDISMMPIGKAMKLTGSFMIPLLMAVGEASAKGGEFGIWEGRTASLLHPVLMGTLFGLSGYAALLGLEWRELRTSGATINDLKAQLPTLSTGSRASSPISKEKAAISAEIKKLEGAEEVDSSKISALKEDLALLASEAVVELDGKVEAAAARRKELAKKDVRDKHHEIGSAILGLGVFAAIEGPVNTFLRAQKLFPGPHLYVGAGITVGWAVAAALVPQMQKGNEAARIGHIVINFGIIGFFAWQVYTGLGITEKVLEFTHWP